MDKKLVVNKEEAALVNRIFEYYLITPSTNTVSKKLNDEGFVTKKRTIKGGSATGGVKFTKESVRTILKNSVYIGHIRFNGEVFAGIHKPIIPLDLFQKVQDRLNVSVIDTQVTANTDSPLTLLGITKCGHCGSLLSTTSTFRKSTGRKYYFYKCSSRLLKNP